MKTRVVQLITFEIDSLDASEPLNWEQEADRIGELAATQLRFDIDGLRAGDEIFLRTQEDMVVMVTVAKVSSDDLQLILLDRRRLHAENVRLHAQREVLRAFIKESCSGPKSVEALDIAEAVNPEPTEDPEETQG